MREVSRNNLTDDDLLTTFRGRGVSGGGGGLRITYQIFVYPSSYKQISPLPVLVGADLISSCINIVNAKKIVAVKEATHAVEKNST